MTAPAAEPFAGSIELTRGYRVHLGHGYDELLNASGKVRSHGLGLVSGLQRLDAGELAMRARRLAQRVRDTGLTYDIFADPRAHAQPWRLNLMPLVVSSAEWRWLEAAMVQRARLLAYVLSDVYAEGRLLDDHLIPPELIFSDESYLPAARDVINGTVGLRFYAADLARGHDGRWRVIDSHTETLAGIGFALANRVTHTHVAGDLFNQVNARRLSPWFRALQEGLNATAGRADARIALMTPGPQSPDYFSHAYIARYLNLLLVEGNDLRVRDGHVALKTLEGLKEIDLIVRCAEGALSDPLELGGTAFLGPAGLLGACRARPDLVINPIGAATVQNRALGARLAQVARHVLGEDLKLADSPRLWLGDPAARAEVARAPSGYTLRAAQEGTGRPGMAASGIELRDLTGEQLDRLIRDMQVHGTRFVAEQRQTFSTMPAYDAGVLVPRPIAIRLFAARTGDDWSLMPAGLAMTVNARSAVSLTADGGETHDVWVLSDEAAGPSSSLWRPTIERARVERSQRVTQSRVAENLYWLGRNVERADWTMRILRGTLRRIEEDSGAFGGQQAAARCMALLLGDDSPALVATGRADIEAAARVLADSKAGRSLANTLASLYRNAFLVRDRLSQEAWQQLSRLAPQGTWGEALTRAPPIALLDLVEEGLGAIAAFNGLAHENMTRNFGWSFLNLGRRLERAYNLAEVTKELFGHADASPENERAGLLLLLELGDSFITYRSRYRLEPMLPLALDLLMLDETNPRSLAFQLAEMDALLERLPHGDAGQSRHVDRRLILKLLTSIRLCDIEQICRDDSRNSLTSLLDEQLAWLPGLSDAISQHYFNLTEALPHRLETRVGTRP
ncbi:MAG: circularly permuted type 2 ATP-grasp protein [Hyphomicrobiaceae bacterium]